MTFKHDYSEIDWIKAKEETRKILIETVKGSEKIISYSNLAEKIKTLQLEPHSDALATMLRDISIDETNQGRGMLSVIVIHKDGDMMPGKGFFDLAKELNKKGISDKVKFWSDEFNKVILTDWNNVV